MRSLIEIKLILWETFLFLVIAVDIFDKSNFTGAKVPQFDEIKEDYPKDLESSVLFPDALFKPSERKGKTILRIF